MFPETVPPAEPVLWTTNPEPPFKKLVLPESVTTVEAESWIPSNPLRPTTE